MVGRIGVLGAGAMGSAVAAFLTEAGQDVILIGRGGAHIRAVAAGGLRVVSAEGSPRQVCVAAVVHAADLPAASLDILIVLTKTYDTLAAVAGVAHALAPDGAAVSLQNGLGNDVKLSSVVGGSRALVGVTTVGATLERPGQISISASTMAGQSVTHIGATGSASATHRADEVAAVLDAAALPVVHAVDVAVPIWGKLALSVMSPISAVLRMTVAGVWASPAGQSLIEQMFDEVVVVGKHQGVNMDRAAAWAHASQVFTGTGEHYTSMCTDVMRARPTELDSMAGAVHELATLASLPAPLHATVISMLGVLGA